MPVTDAAPGPPAGNRGSRPESGSPSSATGHRYRTASTGPSLLTIVCLNPGGNATDHLMRSRLHNATHLFANSHRSRSRSVTRITTFRPSNRDDE
jgi:hypothetical protein